jgi:hypothetical protein
MVRHMSLTMDLPAWGWFLFAERRRRQLVSFKDFQEDRASVELEFKGRKLTLRELCSADTSIVRGYFVRPTPPLYIPKIKALNAEPEPNYNDAAYQSAHREWLGKVNVVEIAIAMEYQTADGKGKPTDPKDFGPWAEAVYTELSRLPDRDLGKLIDAYHKLGAEEARSFSSAPQGADNAPQNSQTSTP